MGFGAFLVCRVKGFQGLGQRGTLRARGLEVWASDVGFLGFRAWVLGLGPGLRLARFSGLGLGVSRE